MSGSSAANLVHAARAGLIKERAGIASERRNARDIALLRQGPAPSVSGPPVIDSQIKSGVATADLLAALDRLGIIADQTTFGDDGVASVQDDALLPSVDRQTIIDGALPVFSGETGDWEPSLTGPPVIVIIQQRHAASDTVSTTSTTTYSTAITLDTVLPAGTWTCLPMFDVRIAHSAGGNADIRVTVNGAAFAAVTQAYNSSVPMAGFQSTLATGIVSDGSTPITVTGDFKANAAGTVTPTGPRLVLIWQRTS